MRQQPAGADTVVNVALGGLGGVVVVAALLRAAASIAAWVSATPPPTGGLASTVAVLARPGGVGEVFASPGLHPGVYWAVTAALLAVAAAGGVWGWRAVTAARNRRDADPHRLHGTAGRADIRRAASRSALLARAHTLRPSLSAPRPADVGYRLGTAHGGDIWATVEDSMLLLGPPRSGKGLHIVIPMIVDAPGAVVTTSTRPDNLTVTLRARSRRGPVAVFDPQRLAPGIPAGMRWSPVRGCEDPLTAMIRATGLASSTNYSSVSDGDFWQGMTISAVQALLHAAALDGRDARTLYQWALNASAAYDAVRVLQSHSRAAHGWAESLDAMLDADPKTRDSIWQGVSQAVSALADPRVLDAVTPRPGESEDFDPDEFLTANGTLYLLATGSGAGASAALVAALIEDLVETARKLAARSPGARLDPPVLMALDEIGNLGGLPSLPVLMAEGGGSGITMLPVLQSLAQARQRWGEHQASAIWDAAIVKILLGGASHTRDLQDLAALIGDRDEETTSTTIDSQGQRSTQRSTRTVPIMQAARLRTLPFGTGVVLLRSAPPIVTTLRPWTHRKDHQQLRTDRVELEALIRHAA